MMHTMTETQTTTKGSTPAEPCPCGCAECEPVCCGLGCLVQPRFFCGQLLTDRDMTALVSWAKQKFALARYRHGWGVVCGLDVRRDPSNPSRVIIGPGYAIDCCGDDIIVCEPTSKDLSTACPDLQEECFDPWARRVEEPSDPQARAYQAQAPGSWLEQHLTEATAVDLFIHYQEELSEPQTALVRGQCQQVSECEYSRTRESFKLTWKPEVENGSHSPAPQKESTDYVPALSEFMAKWSTNPDRSEDVKGWFREWLKQNPPRQFPFVQEWVEQVSPDAINNDLVEMLFWLAEDYRHSQLGCDCFSCETESGVPLARVWLHVVRTRNSKSCQVLTINPYPPYRRPLTQECWPAGPGCIHVGELIWQTPEQAHAVLARRGIHSTENIPRFTVPGTLAALKTELVKSKWPTVCGAEVVLQVMETRLAGERVIGVWAKPQGKGTSK